MSNIHNNGEQNKSLNDALDKLGHVYGQLKQDEPPELLNLAILNSAHRAVEKKPHWMKFGWMHGLTTAAVFVLAFSIILNQREPSLEYESGLRRNQPTDLQHEKAAKKLSVGESKSELSNLTGKEDERRQEMPQSTPAATVLEISEMESVPADMVDQAVSERQRTSYASDDLAGKTDNDGKNAAARQLIFEETMVDEADSVPIAPQAGAVSKQARTVATAAPVASAPKENAGTDSKAERALLAIIKLKQDGNESWKTELESFRKLYPNYPLPDVLTREDS